MTKIYKAYIVNVETAEPYEDIFEGEANSPQEFHKNISMGEKLTGQFQEDPTLYIKEIRNEQDIKVFDNNTGFIS